jgi:integrase/recombinase XerD
MPVPLSVQLDNRRLKKKTGKYPVKLMVTHEREPQRYQTVYELTQQEYDNLSASRVSEKMQKVRDELKLIKRGAEDLADKLEPFTFAEFEKEFILNNPFFRQRRVFKKAAGSANLADYKFDFTPYHKKFPHPDRRAI